MIELTLPGGSGSVSLEEQETTINFCRTEEAAEVWTSDRTVMTRLDKLCETAPDNYQVKEVGKDRTGALLCKTYTIKDKGLLSFRPRRMNREYTEEQRAEMSERGKRLRAAQLADSRDTGV